jgi:hypothetical protein
MASSETALLLLFYLASSCFVTVLPEPFIILWMRVVTTKCMQTAIAVDASINPQLILPLCSKSPSAAQSHQSGLVNHLESSDVQEWSRYRELIWKGFYRDVNLSGSQCLVRGLKWLWMWFRELKFLYAWFSQLKWRGVHSVSGFWTFMFYFHRAC